MKTLFSLDYLVTDFAKKYQSWQFSRYSGLSSLTLGGGGPTGKRSFTPVTTKDNTPKRTKGAGTQLSTNPTLRPCIKTWSRCSGNTPISRCDATCKYAHDDVINVPRSTAKMAIDKYFIAKSDKAPLVKLVPWVARQYDTVQSDASKEALRLHNRDL